MTHNVTLILVSSKWNKMLGINCDLDVSCYTKVKGKLCSLLFQAVLVTAIKYLFIWRPRLKVPECIMECYHGWHWHQGQRQAGHPHRPAQPWGDPGRRAARYGRTRRHDEDSYQVRTGDTSQDPIIYFICSGSGFWYFNWICWKPGEVYLKVADSRLLDFVDCWGWA